MPAPIRVLVVDDSTFMRRVLLDTLAPYHDIEVVEVARTGVEAVLLNRELQPDVITLDVEMPEMTGLEALPSLIAGSAARVVMLSNLDDTDTTYSALAAGAVDFMPKPHGRVNDSLEALGEELAAKIRVAYRIKPALRLVADAIAIERASKQDAALRMSRDPSHVVAIAASTGGPPALERLLSGLTGSLPAAYLVVQHLPSGFTTSLVRRLAAVTDIRVREAEEGMRVEAGVAYIAPSGAHMRVVGPKTSRARIHLDASEPVHGVRPAADPLFESVAHRFGDRALGVVLTGMGSDGADGLAAIRSAGGRTFAQDEDTSVVWGMPGACVKAGVVDRVVSLHLVARELRGILKEA